MNRRFKWSILALLGFSTACSSVKNTVKNDPTTAGQADSTVVGGKVNPQIIVMYGVRPPVGDPLQDGRVIDRAGNPQQPVAPESPESSSEPSAPTAPEAADDGTTPQTDR